MYTSETPQVPMDICETEKRCQLLERIEKLFYKHHSITHSQYTFLTSACAPEQDMQREVLLEVTLRENAVRDVNVYSRYRQGIKVWNVRSRHRSVAQATTDPKGFGVLKKSYLSGLFTFEVAYLINCHEYEHRDTNRCKVFDDLQRRDIGPRERYHMELITQRLELKNEENENEIFNALRLAKKASRRFATYHHKENASDVFCETTYWSASCPILFILWKHRIRAFARRARDKLVYRKEAKHVLHNAFHWPSALLPSVGMYL
jgi:hypothetical protein